MSEPIHPFLKWTQPMKLEERQGFTNRSVVGGLDRFMIEAISLWERENRPILVRVPDVSTSLDVLKREFSQYLSYDKNQRQRLIQNAMRDLSVLHEKLDSLKVSPVGPQASDVPLQDLIPPGKMRAFRLLGLKNLEDLFYYTPKWVVDLSRLTPIAQGSGEDPGFFLAQVNGVSQTRHGKQEVIKVNLQDGSGRLTWVWFNRPYLKKEIEAGRWVLIHDKIQDSPWGKQVVGRAGTHEFLTEKEVKGLREGKTLVFYPSTPTLGQDFWHETMAKVFAQCSAFLEERLACSPKLLRASLEQLHLPSNLVEFEKGRQTLSLEELLVLQSFLLLKRKEVERRQKGREYQFNGPRVTAFRKTIPYKLTGAQTRVLKEIRTDLSKPYPMNRLLQGDVGSGKTLVAAIAFLYAADSGVQSAFMAPTEILAHQHFRFLEKVLSREGLKTVLLTSDMKASEKRTVLEAMRKGKADVAVGTHALLEEDVQFSNLGFMVIDERHKFGVLQRATLENKGRWPDALMMTATPFPRALVLTEYGDTDLSLLDEMPKGRKPIQTFWRSESQKNEVYQKVRERVLRGEQAYVVYPVVEESKSFLKSATQMYEFFKNETFHGFKLGLLHGRMKKEDKEEVMRMFLEEEIQILVSTTVVEVGLDISNATVMVVEHAERFGLAQLHQLRGRVGRGDQASFCYLISSPVISADAKLRLKTMVSTLDGFKLSEMDLKMRGPGEIFGLAQSGKREEGLVDLKRDGELAEQARRKAEVILEVDPRLENPDNQTLREKLNRRYHGLLNLAQIS
jgi:ATP-dependent DNA helicase RecG